MIIKSMSRSSSSFNQLLDYLDKEKTLDRHSWNMYADRHNNDDLENEFMRNAEHIKEARGRVYMYHEVLSLEKNDLSLSRQREIIFDLANEYVKQRADNHLVYGAIHNDTKNIHIHLIISSNKVNANKRFRLSKNELAQIQSNVQEYKNSKFKELSRTNYYQNTKDPSKSKQAEQEIKHSRKKQTIKEQVNENLRTIFKKSFSKEQFNSAMKQRGYEFYEKGNTRGIKVNGKSYRFKTLGLEQSYQNTLNRFERTKSREQKRSESKKEKIKSRGRIKNDLNKSKQNYYQSKFDKTKSREQKRSESKKEKTKSRGSIKDDLNKSKQNSYQNSSSKDSSYSR
jgi:hypothetical protein